MEEEAQLQPPIILGLLGAILAFAVLIPYLLGSINSAVVISRLLYHDDVRNHGSGNAGTTNMLRTYGKVAALLTLLGDVLKTVLAVCIGSFTLSAAIGGWIAAFFCMIGHIFPIYYRFRGGKGVLCVATAVAMLSPFAFVCDLLAFIIIVSMTKYVSLGSIFGGLTLPLFVNVENKINPYGTVIEALVAIAMALLILWCHRANIQRIRDGKESKLSFKSKSKKDGEGK
ncbi:MAG: glycerol-3-phosphate 1-O-acyltransferase PlsY [Clostridia bacterium]|nr:glycerol-3-phosphate 1-O-acyltransferase PlsY [Clostridia bacterium]